MCCCKQPEQTAVEPADTTAAADAAPTPQAADSVTISVAAGSARKPATGSAAAEAEALSKVSDALRSAPEPIAAGGQKSPKSKSKSKSKKAKAATAKQSNTKSEPPAAADQIVIPIATPTPAPAPVPAPATSLPGSVDTKSQPPHTKKSKSKSKPSTGSAVAVISAPVVSSSAGGGGGGAAVSGFSNVGNTCYINSLLQCLLASPHFVGALKHHSKSVESSSAAAMLTTLVNGDTSKVGALVSRLENLLGVSLRAQSDSGDFLQNKLLPQLAKECGTTAISDVFAFNVNEVRTCQVILSFATADTTPTRPGLN